MPIPDSYEKENKITNNIQLKPILALKTHNLHVKPCLTFSQTLQNNPVQKSKLKLSPKQLRSAKYFEFERFTQANR